MYFIKVEFTAGRPSGHKRLSLGFFHFNGSLGLEYRALTPSWILNSIGVRSELEFKPELKFNWKEFRPKPKFILNEIRVWSQVQFERVQIWTLVQFTARVELKLRPRTQVEVSLNQVMIVRITIEFTWNEKYLGFCQCDNGAIYKRLPNFMREKWQDC